MVATLRRSQLWDRAEGGGHGEAAPAMATRGCRSPQGSWHSLCSTWAPFLGWLTHSEKRPGLAWQPVFAGALDALCLQRRHRRKPLRVGEDRPGEVRAELEDTWVARWVKVLAPTLT